MRVDKLTSILAVIDPADESRHVVAKAMVLARHFRRPAGAVPVRLRNTPIRCVTRTTRRALPRRAARALNNGQRFLDTVRSSLAGRCFDHDACAPAPARCTKPSSIGCRKTQPDLVIKSAAGHHPVQRFTLDANDWQLARTCPAPLMLTRGPTVEPGRALRGSGRYQ